MRNYWHAPDRRALIERVQRVRADTPRRWGLMNAHQMVCHVSDTFRAACGDIHVKPRGLRLERPVRWAALYVPLPWPRGYPAPRALRQIGGTGTPPALFEQDMATLLQLMERFTPAVARGRIHPLWGALSEWEWGRWAYLHTHHHLRQFGA